MIIHRGFAVSIVHFLLSAHFCKGQQCKVKSPGLLGNGVCNLHGKYNTAECNFDGGDCNYYNSLPNCRAKAPNELKNGNCRNTVPYNTDACASDGGDCDDFNSKYDRKKCAVRRPDEELGNRDCSPKWNTKDCKWDGGDCCKKVSIKRFIVSGDLDIGNDLEIELKMNGSKVWSGDARDSDSNAVSHTPITLKKGESLDVSLVEFDTLSPDDVAVGNFGLKWFLNNQAGEYEKRVVSTFKKSGSHKLQLCLDAKLPKEVKKKLPVGGKLEYCFKKVWGGVVTSVTFIIKVEPCDIN